MQFSSISFSLAMFALCYLLSTYLTQLSSPSCGSLKKTPCNEWSATPSPHNDFQKNREKGLKTGYVHCETAKPASFTVTRFCTFISIINNKTYIHVVSCSFDFVYICKNASFSRKIKIKPGPKKKNTNTKQNR